MTIKHSMLLLALSVLAVPALAKEETPLPKELPPYAADKPLPVPEIRQETLGNGLKVWLVKRTGFPKINVSLVVRGGNAADSAAMRGTAGMMAGLLNEGTTRHSSRQLAEALQAIGGEVGGSAGDDGVFVTGEALRSHAATLIDLGAEVALHPTFPKEEVELAKENALQGLQAQEAQPAFHARRAFLDATMGSHPYAFATMTAESIKAITPESLAAAHAARFRPDQALLVIGGDFDQAAILAEVKKAYGGWKATGTALPATPAAPTTAKPQLIKIDRPGSVQTTLRIGRPAIPATSEDAIPLTVATLVLGGGFHSRITNNIREDKGYTYSPGLRVSRQQVGGMLAFSGDVRSEVTGASINEVLYEFDRMGTTDVSADELTGAKRFASGTYQFSNQIQSAVVGSLASNWLVGLPPEYLGTYVGKINQVTTEQVRAMSRKYYAAKDQTVVAVGDLSKIDADLAQFGDFTKR